MATYTAPLFGQEETDAARVCYSAQLTGKDVVYANKYINIRKYPTIYKTKGSIVLRSVDIHLVNKAFLSMPDFNNLDSTSFNYQSKPPIYRVGTLTGLWWDMPDGRWHYIQLNHQLLAYDKDGNFTPNQSAKPINSDSEFYGLDNSYCIGFAREDRINHFFDFDRFRKAYVVLRDPAIKQQTATKNLLINTGLIAGIGAGLLTKKYGIAAAAGAGMLAKKIYDQKKYTLTMQGARIQNITKYAYVGTPYQIYFQFKLLFQCVVKDATKSIVVNPTGFQTIILNGETIQTSVPYVDDQYTQNVSLKQYELLPISIVSSIAVNTPEKTALANKLKTLKEGDAYPAINYTMTLPYTVDGVKYTATFSGTINEIHRLHKGTFVAVNGLATNKLQ